MMSTAGLVFLSIGVLLISTCYSDSEVSSESSPRNRSKRSFVNLWMMIGAITGRDGRNFFKYGNWCGEGGEGPTVDALDKCCQQHDACYNMAHTSMCTDGSDFDLDISEYKWHLDGNGRGVCEYQDGCPLTLCACDLIMSNCLKSYNLNNEKYSKLEL